MVSLVLSIGWRRVHPIVVFPGCELWPIHLRHDICGPGMLCLVGVLCLLLFLEVRGVCPRIQYLSCITLVFGVSL